MVNGKIVIGKEKSLNRFKMIFKKIQVISTYRIRKIICFCCCFAFFIVCIPLSFIPPITHSTSTHPPPLCKIFFLLAICEYVLYSNPEYYNFKQHLCMFKPYPSLFILFYFSKLQPPGTLLCMSFRCTA